MFAWVSLRSRFLMIMYEECMRLGVDAKALKVGEFYSSTTDYITSYSDSYTYHICWKLL